MGKNGPTGHKKILLTMYQSLLMALVSLPFCVLENWGLKKKISYTQKRIRRIIIII